MTQAFGATDAEGAWVWKDAYEAAEAAVVLFLKRYGRAMRRRAGAGGPPAMLALLQKIAALEPSHTKRSESQVRLQQFSTPLGLAYAALQAAAIRPGDIVLEPSAGTGILAVMAECALGAGGEGALHLNEIAGARAGLLSRLFPKASVTGFNAEAIADRLPAVRPTVVLMNPPFSASPGVHRIRHDADLRHLRSAFAMLGLGGRLVAVTSAGCMPGDRVWKDAFERLDPPARVVFSMAIDGRAYARRGTTFDTRLTVLDRSGDREHAAIDPVARADSSAELLAAVMTRRSGAPRHWRYRDPGYSRSDPGPFRRHGPVQVKRAQGHGQAAAHRPAEDKDRRHDWGPVSELAYATAPVSGDAPAGSETATGPYAPWKPGIVHVPGAVVHPTPLVQSAAMAAVPHPARPTVRCCRSAW